VLLPGGYGTLDEAFELLTLMQTGKTAIRPVILLDPPGSGYWDEWLMFVQEHLIERGLCAPEDLALVEKCESIASAVDGITRFYANYHSARYVGERLILRMHRAPSNKQLVRLNSEFGDVLARGRLERTRVSPAEAKEDDAVALERLCLHPTFNFGRLRQLIDQLNLIEL